jgi:ubiquinone/menaquinone biosynthesis C-methylase UbiE
MTEVKTWNKIFNNPNLSWVLETNKILVSTDKSVFDSSFELHKAIFDCDKNTFKSYVEYMMDFVETNSSIAEFGCGNAALLHYLHHTYGNDVYGIDISKQLIDQCMILFPMQAHHFFVSDKKIPITDNKVDWFISNSVFQYLSYDDADYVTQEMLRCSKYGVVISDVKDKETENLFKEKQANRQNLTLEQLSEKYKTTPLTFYDKSFFDKYKNVEIVPMLTSYPDAELGSYTVVIRK